MEYIDGAIITNVGEKSVQSFLVEQGCADDVDTLGMQLENRLGILIEKKKLNKKVFEDFLFEELFFGKRKLIHIYMLDSFKKILYESDWLDKLKKKHGCKTLNYNNLINTHVSSGDKVKVGAIKSKTNDEGELVRLQIIFVYYIDINKNGHLSSSYSYIPVDFDFNKRIIVVKAWNRKYIEKDYHKPIYLMEHIIEDLMNLFKFTIKEFSNKHQKILYRMSKGLIEELFENITAYSDIDCMSNEIQKFIKATTNNIELENVIYDEDGNKLICDDVIDLKDELIKLLQRLVVSDFFLLREFDDVWEMNLSAIITCIRFNDTENITARLTGENRKKAIFCSKTFMSLLKSIEEVQEVEALWIAYEKDRGTVELKYDATNRKYLCVMILSQRCYSGKDFSLMWEMFKKYEPGVINKVKRHCRQDVS